MKTTMCQIALLSDCIMSSGFRESENSLILDFPFLLAFFFQVMLVGLHLADFLFQTLLLRADPFFPESVVAAGKIHIMLHSSGQSQPPRTKCILSVGVQSHQRTFLIGPPYEEAHQHRQGLTHQPKCRWPSDFKKKTLGLFSSENWTYLSQISVINYHGHCQRLAISSSSFPKISSFEFVCHLLRDGWFPGVSSWSSNYRWANESMRGNCG